MTTLATVKKALRIGHSQLDDEITRLIGTAQAEMIRAGVTEEAVNEGGSLVTQAAVTFCLMNMTEEKNLIDRYEESFRLQVDNIRKSHPNQEEDGGDGTDPEETEPNEAEGD